MLTCIRIAAPHGEMGFMMFAKSCRYALVLLALSTRALSVLASDTPSSNVPPRTMADITNLLDQYKPDHKKVAELRSVLDSLPPQTQDKQELAKFYRTRAVAADRVGRVRNFFGCLRVLKVCSSLKGVAL